MSERIARLLPIIVVVRMREERSLLWGQSYTFFIIIELRG
jgi:hypothetical protein